MLKELKKVSKFLIELCGCAYVITALWRVLEELEFGEIQVRSVDTIIATLFSLALVGLLRTWWKEPDDGRKD